MPADGDGQLVVIDRIKDLAETSRGERFSPQYLENKLKFSPYIAETVVLGAGRDVLAAMICIRFSIISKWAEKKRISFTTYTDLASRPEVYALLRKEVEAVNATLPPAQRIAKFLLLYKELDADDGELTLLGSVPRRGAMPKDTKDIELSPDGNFLYVVGSGARQITAYKIGDNRLPSELADCCSPVMVQQGQNITGLAVE